MMRVILSLLVLFILLFDSAKAPMSIHVDTASAGTQKTARPVPDELSPFNRTPRDNEQRMAYLTFDDGPSLNTMAILDILDRYKVKATFFVMGNEEPYAMRGYREIKRRGHIIALHSFSHNYSVIYRSKAGFFEDLNRLESLLKNKYGISTRLVRFPGGSKNITTRQAATKNVIPEIIHELDQKGYVYCDWNVDSTDGISPSISEQKIVNSVLKGTSKKKQAVILLHDINSMKNTVRALPAVIEGLRNQGFQFDTVPEDSQMIQFK
jgi:peptidoglycan-N-acetylglucosamine deacetylase